eukprot:TRINITY_DN2924_c0_g1_i1.p1 TRINITY_DN2924_c0_g1~~TRINITY_DN2924_c0_g1_i1.p1  ORF type:complete len:208 (+),score=55.82 TRINITY_DN2924_c0_g1_i1:39-626(+)
MVGIKPENIQRVMHAVYSLRPETDKVIDENYSLDVQFHDPLVTIKGVTELKGQFHALRAIFRSSDVRIIRILTAATIAFAEFDVTFYPYLLPRCLAVSVRVLTVLELDTAGKIMCQTDHWNLQESLALNCPTAGCILAAAQRASGWLTSGVANVVLTAATRSLTQKQTIPPKPHQSHEARVGVAAEGQHSNGLPL